MQSFALASRYEKLNKKQIKCEFIVITIIIKQLIIIITHNQGDCEVRNIQLAVCDGIMRDPLLRRSEHESWLWTEEL